MSEEGSWAASKWYHVIKSTAHNLLATNDIVTSQIRIHVRETTTNCRRTRLQVFVELSSEWRQEYWKSIDKVEHLMQ